MWKYTSYPRQLIYNMRDTRLVFWQTSAKLSAIFLENSLQDQNACQFDATSAVFSKRYSRIVNYVNDVHKFSLFYIRSMNFVNVRRPKCVTSVRIIMHRIQFVRRKNRVK